MSNIKIMLIGKRFGLYKEAAKKEHQCTKCNATIKVGQKRLSIEDFHSYPIKICSRCIEKLRKFLKSN